MALPMASIRQFNSILATDLLVPFEPRHQKQLQLFCIAMVFATLTQPIAAYLQAHGADAYVGRMSLLNSTLGLGGIAIGAAIGGAKGAATAAVVQEVALLCSLVPRLPSARFAHPSKR